MRMNDDILKLKSGRKFYCNRGLISINDKLETAEGYDGSIPSAPFYDNYVYDENSFTKEEAIELANIMINRWNNYKNKCKNIK